MKGFFDTSVLVPLFYRDHVHHKSGTVHSIYSVNGMLRSAQFGGGVRNTDEDAG